VRGAIYTTADPSMFPSGTVLYFIRDLEVRKHTAPTEKFFYFKKTFTLLKAVAGKILDDDFEQS